jgi:hypothetical protein
MRRLLVVLLVAAAAAPVHAHHEAIFGPHSALAFSGKRFVTAQVFTRRTGPRGQRVQETTTVLSGAFTPGRLPLSIAIVTPFSVIAAPDGRQIGLENAFVSARYQLELSPESYLMGLGGIELPTGTIDDDFGEGAPAGLAAGLLSAERRPLSFIAYGFLHRYAERDHIRNSGNTIMGAGAAWTPVDEPQGRIVSFQLGISREGVSRERVDGLPRHDSGGWVVVTHPTVVWGSNERLLYFVSTSLPLAQKWRDPADREHFRAGGGAILRLGD